MRIATAFLLIVGFGVVLITTLDARGSGSYPLLYSQVLIAIIVLLLLFVALYEVRAANSGSDARPVDDPVAWQSVAGLAAVTVYVMSWSWIGHAPATAAFLLVALLISGVRKPLVLLAFVVLLPTALHFFFFVFLRIPLPKPWWT